MKRFVIFMLASCFMFACSTFTATGPPVHDQTEFSDVGYPATLGVSSFYFPLLPVEAIPVVEGKYVKRTFLGHNKKQNRYLRQLYGKRERDKEQSIAAEIKIEDLKTNEDFKPPAWQLEESKVKDQA